MRNFTRIVWICVSVAVFGVKAFAAEPPRWAYPVNPPSAGGHVDDGQPLRVPDSDVSYVRSELKLVAGNPVADWHPDRHPPMPEIVSHGRKESGLSACGFCHLPNGSGRPENTSLAGLTPGYFKAQMEAFRNDERMGSEADRNPQNTMITMAKKISDADIETAAAYFASVTPEKFVEVIETETVPRTIVAGWMLARDPEGGTEPIGNRIIEIAEDFEQFEKRDSRTPYVAYAPIGSRSRGAVLVASGGGKTITCAICHGADFNGLADVPRLAGRSPSYLFRQLFDMREGARTGGASVLMNQVVENLTDEDMVDISAFLASCSP